MEYRRVRQKPERRRIDIIGLSRAGGPRQKEQPAQRTVRLGSRPRSCGFEWATQWLRPRTGSNLPPPLAEPLILLAFLAGYAVRCCSVHLLCTFRGSSGPHTATMTAFGLGVLPPSAATSVVKTKASSVAWSGWASRRTAMTSGRRRTGRKLPAVFGTVSSPSVRDRRTCRLARRRSTSPQRSPPASSVRGGSSARSTRGADRAPRPRTDPGRGTSLRGQVEVGEGIVRHEAGVPLPSEDGTGRLPASATELERCRLWMLSTFGRAQAALAGERGVIIADWPIFSA